MNNERIEEHERAVLLHQLEGVRARRKGSVTVYGLLYQTGRVHAAHRRLKYIVYINIHVAFVRVLFGDVVDSDPGEGIGNRVSVGWGVMHIVLIIAQPAVSVIIPGTRVKYP